VSAPGTLGLAERVHRARRIGLTFGRVYLGIKTNQLIARSLSPPDMSERWRRFNVESAQSIYRTAIELRGLILKGCQFLGSRADVLPPEYVRVLSKLQDRVPPKGFPVVRRSVERELGRPLEALFAEFAETPLASASLAQVHEARLHGGERVAVKVQYPEIADLVRSDLANLRTLFRAVGLLERDVDLMPLVDELGIEVPRELDFVNEGRNAERMARLLAHREDVVVPRIHWELTTRRVLVMEFAEGLRISDVEALQARGVDLQALLRTLVECYCEQVLVQGFFHADPHPGNLFVQVEPSAASGAPARHRLVMLDFGLSKDLPAGFREGAIAFAGALLLGRAEAMAEALVALGFETRTGSTHSLRELSRILLEAASRARHQASLDPALAQEVGEELSRLVRRDPIVRMPTHVVLLGRTLGLLSGLGSTLGARLDLLTTVLPYAVGTARPAPPPARPRAPA
jgi:predicted unusual protein kinase regulating ubiquinone biosynthesis (AarF/ABC1/UbiB family)